MTSSGNTDDVPVPPRWRSRTSGRRSAGWAYRPTPTRRRSGASRPCPGKVLASRRDGLDALNRIIYTTERAFRHEAGLPNRDWFKHLIYAPGLYTGYGVKTLPGIREGVERGAWDEASAHVTLVASAIDRLARQLDEATRRLHGLLK